MRQVLIIRHWVCGSCGASPKETITVDEVIQHMKVCKGDFFTLAVF